MTPKQFIALNAIFTAAEFAATLGDRAPASHDSILAYHHRAGHLLRLRRGLYAAIPPGTKPDPATVDPFVLAAKLAPDSILAYHAALAFHCNIPPVHRRFHYLTATAPREFRFGRNIFSPVHFPNALRVHGQTLWGVQDVQRNGITLRVTSVERTVVDVLDRLELGGRLEESWRSAEAFEHLDLDRVVEYVLLLGSATTAAKVGLFLSQHCGNLKVSDSHLATLRRHLPVSPHYIQQRRRLAGDAIRLVRDWNIIVPKKLFLLPGKSRGRRQSV